MDEKVFNQGELEHWKLIKEKFYKNQEQKQNYRQYLEKQIEEKKKAQKQERESDKKDKRY